MTSGPPISDQERLDAELTDAFDEELELEIDDERLEALISLDGQPKNSFPRATYFKELFRLQRELVKIQDWIVTQKLKVVVIFEGREAAGQGQRDQAHHTAA